MQAQTRYARSGDVAIAYQVIGDGPFDVVFVPGSTSHVELNWEVPALRRLHERIASFCRLIVFDKRGTACPTGCRARRRSRCAWTTSAPSWTLPGRGGRR